MKAIYRNKCGLVGRFVFGAFMVITAVSFTANAQDIAATTNAVRTEIVPLAVEPGSAGRQTSDADSDWSGFYVGGYVGGAFGRSDAHTTTVFSEDGYFTSSSVDAINAAGDQRVKPNGFGGGVTFGGNKQFGALVVGVEADFGALASDDAVTVSQTYPCCSPNGFEIAQSIENKWLFTARPRVGVAAGNLLVYGTGGLAVTDLTYDAFFTDDFDAAEEFATIEETRTGWTAGAGAEFKLGSKWSVKGEYLCADFGRVTTTSTNLTTTDFSWPENPFTHSADLKMHNVRFGINFHF